MATQAELDYDRMRIKVARLVEEALGCPDGIVSYFENYPDDDEQPGDTMDGDGLSWNTGEYDDDEEDAVYRVAASAVFGLSKTDTVEDGFRGVLASVGEVAHKFEAARLLLAEKEVTLG